jgi:hypothetical protein
VKYLRVLLALTSIVLLIVAVLTYYEGIKVLNEAEKTSNIYEKVTLWFRSALYMIVFTVVVLLLILSVSATIYVTIFKGEKNIDTWVR